MHIKTYIFLASFFCTLLLIPNAYTQPFHVENTTAHSIKIAVAYNAKNGVTYEGWYSVNPRAKATFDVPSITDNVAWYAQSPEGYFWGGDDGNSADVTLDVTMDNFKVIGVTPLKGKTFKARFKNINLSQGAYHLRLTD